MIYTQIYTYAERGVSMEKAKLFLNGGSQAVRLPKSCRFEGQEVLVNKVGDVVMLMPVTHSYETIVKGLQMMSEDCLETPIEDFPLQEREELK